MADGLRPLRWRAGLVLAWVVMSGQTSHLIQSDYTWGGGFLDSAAVEIDGEVVGVLEPYAEGMHVTGFRVEPGEHVVRVLREGCEGVPETVTLGAASGRLRSSWRMSTTAFGAGCYCVEEGSDGSAVAGTGSSEPSASSAGVFFFTIFTRLIDWSRAALASALWRIM